MERILFASSLGASILAFGAAGLVVHGITCLFSGSSNWKKSNAKDMILSLVALFSNAFSVSARVITKTVTGILRWWLLVAVVFFLLSFFYVSYNEYPSIWVSTVQFYNIVIGPLVHQLVVIPLQVLDVMLRGLLPIWDSAWWFFKTLLSQGMLPILVKEGELVFKIATCVVNMIVNLCGGLFSFVEAFTCTGEKCLHPEAFVLDILSSLLDVREIAYLSTQLLKSFCGTLSTPMDILVYPLLDLNLMEGLHSLVNSVLQLFMVVPATTVERCALGAGADQFKIMLCTPDLNPVFNLLASGVSSLGMALDNWINIAFLIVQEALTGQHTECQTENMELIPDLLAKDPVFSGTSRIVVGLTDWLYAVTDGITAVYKGSNDPGSKIQSWPSPVDVSMGIAAVVYSTVHDVDVSAISGLQTSSTMQTTSMLGCTCTDDVTGALILCSILPMAGIPPGAPYSEYGMQVMFPDDITANLLTCAGIDIYVKSSRFPFTRYEAPVTKVGSGGTKTGLPNTDCISRGTCREVDATVWVVPRCGTDAWLNKEKACIETATCYPFCMAARASGSGNDNLILAGARRWREGLTIQGQDCAMEASIASSVSTSMSNTHTVSRAEGSSSDLLQSGMRTGVFTRNLDSPQCKKAARVTSVVPKPPKQAGNIILRGQPFVITGDSIFTEIPLGGGASSLQVERLSGDQINVFSLTMINQHLPAEPRTLTPQAENQYTGGERVLLPYSYQTMGIVATSSRNYVFYASNPDASVFGAYLDYCHDRDYNPNALGKFGMMITSSYGPIRIYRVSAYRRCATYSCGSDLVSYVTIPGLSTDFSRSCNQTFNVGVLALEYLNEDNIAVTVQVSKVTDYWVSKRKFSGNHTFTKTLWLNPSNMLVADKIWQTRLPASTYTTLCPAMQRLPRVGSFGAEVLNSGIFLVRYLMFAVLYTPGMVPIWQKGGVCPSATVGTYYHGVLNNCGGDLYSLEDVFDSLEDASAMFWHSLSLIAHLVIPSGDTAAMSITNILDGMSLYGEGSVNLWATKNKLMTLTNVPIAEQATRLWATLHNHGVMPQGGSLAGTAILAWSRFAYKAVMEIVMAVVKRVVGNPLSITPGEVWTLLINTLYELKPVFASMVTAKTRMGCGGLKLMLGIDNPWSDMIYYQCMAAAELPRGMMSLALNIFVDTPMARCVCKEGSGRDISVFTSSICAPSLPVSLLSTLYMIVNEARGSNSLDHLLCANVIEFVKSDITSSLDPWFENSFAALDAMTSAVDYMMIPFDDESGRCLDFEHDPHVVVLVPEPMDYFHRCAGTSRCKQLCSAEWGRFMSVKAPPIPMPEMNVQVESMFFPGMPDGNLMLSNATAVVEVNDSSLCLNRSSAFPRDFAVAVAESSGNSLIVQFWCAPQMASATVYRNQTLDYGASSLPGSLISAQFGDSSGLWMALLVEIQGNPLVFVLDKTGLKPSPTAGLSLPAHVFLVRISSLWVVDGAIVIDMITKTLEGTKTVYAVPGMSHFFWKLSGAFAWYPTELDLSQFGGNQYWYTRMASGKYLFIPRLSSLPPQSMHITATNQSITVRDAELMKTMDVSGLNGYILASSSLGENYVFATTNSGWDWLRQVRLQDGYIQGVFNSGPIDVTIQTDGRCDEISCEGCPNILVQRMCLAYNKCALVRCVGTPVHQRRPLCGVGSVLRNLGYTGIRSTQASWRIFSEMLGLTMQLTLLNLREAYLLWPEDQFLCSVCHAKDISAEFFSILTSTLNSALQLGNAPVGYLYGGARNVDTNSDAVLTLSATSLNAFMHQVALLPLYAMVSGHQVMMCRVNGMLAILRSDQFTISLTPAEGSASDIMVGQCMTVGSQIMSQYPLDNKKSVGRNIGSFASNAIQTLLISAIEPFVHVIDAFLCYLIGVIHSLGDLIMSQNMAACNPPDFYLQDVVNCSCGDDRLQIQAARRSESISGFGLWCSGVLSMTDSNNKPFFVYNPYSYAELQAMSSGLQAYVKCVSGGSNGYQCPLPEGPDGIFRQQGVSLFNVLVKCRENYVKRRWDPAAYILYNRNMHYMMKTPLYVPVPDSDGLSDPHGVGECMRGDLQSGSIVQSCLEKFFIKAKITDDMYWAYERLQDQSMGPEFTDACLVFSGPSSRNVTPFTLCTDGPGQGNCILSEHIWSPRSNNSVPVAEQHRVLSHGNSSAGLVQRLYREAQDEVNRAVTLALGMLNQSESSISVDFFSVEGDVLHQTMDCIMMGPYSRVDYWPMPVCAQGEECLPGPYWARDELKGGSRQVDPNACPSSPNLPYTCGSPARRALMKYLVKNVLPGRNIPGNKNMTLMYRVLKETLKNIREDWADLSLYGCLCEDNITHLPSCCTPNSTLLPDSLNKSFTVLQTDTILAALESDLGDMHNSLLHENTVWTQWLDPVEKSKYDWSGSQRAKDEARYNPLNPVVRYDSSEAVSPLLTPTSTLWDICHACLKQVFFTLPIGDSGVPFDSSTIPFDGDAGKLEEYVRNFTAGAFLRSPLYRHYSPRHAPSQSQMCLKKAGMSNPVTEKPGTLDYGDYYQAKEQILSGQELPEMDVYDAQSFQIGEERCMCGWPQKYGSSSGMAMCKIDYDVCVAMCQESGSIRCVDDDEYSATCNPTRDAWFYKADEPAVLDKLSKDWKCPDSDLSAHWGFMDASAAEQWLAGGKTLKTSSRDLLEHGRAGLRIGNLDVLKDMSTNYISPATREAPLSRGILTTCEPAAGLTDDLTQKFLDQLFPAAQAAEESGAVAYCMRYVIELARLEVLNLTMRGSREFSMQREAATKWGKRCNSQLQVLRLCTNLDVFKPITTGAGVNRACQHFQLFQDYGWMVYATPACLVNVDGKFYDPCRCRECTGIQVKIAVSSFIKAECEIRFDPRKLVKEGPIGWYDGMPADDLDSLLVDSFQQDVLADPDATANVKAGSSWWEAEGFMSETADSCDGVLDWWPDDWDYPVGYHVTVPCMASETAYRSFTQYLALGSDANGPNLVYHHDLLRDSSLIDTNFGVAGLCRTGTFGMPMPETNTMRYCTRVRNGGGEDFTLPVQDGVDNSDYGWTDEKCTTASTDLPWPSQQVPGTGSDVYASFRFSVGTVPNMPAPEAETYPDSFENLMSVGPIQEIQSRNSWGLGGSRCSDPELYYCLTDEQCPSGFACRGRVCSGDRGRNCNQSSDCQGAGTCQGVCLDKSTVSCIKHSDCSPDYMCNGLGQCTQPVLAVQNRLGQENISFSLASQAGCDDATMLTYDMLGGSFWAYTGEDLLRAHGMCSFEDWFKYTLLANNKDCARQMPNQSYIEIDPSKCPMINLQAAGPNTSKWWQAGKSRPDMMFIRPTACDRDYERLDGFEQCAPRAGSAAVKQITQGTTTTLAYDRFIRLHNSATSMPLALMPFLNETSFGFLGLGYGAVKDINTLETSQNPFVPCANLHQCYASDFTVNGVLANRTVRGTGGRMPYPSNSQFKCGVFGIESGDTCILDKDVVPLYRYLCDQSTMIQECTGLVPGVTSICSNIPVRYTQSNNDRTTVLQGLVNLFYSFRAFKTFSDYLDTTTCMNSIFTDISSRAKENPGQISKGLYYPTMYALYEFPFDWFYQCMVMAGWQVKPLRRGLQDCPAYNQRGTRSLDDYQTQLSGSDPWDVFLRFARGGYLKEDVEKFERNNKNQSQFRLSSAIKTVKDKMYGQDGNDVSYPQCSVNQIWKVGLYGDDYVSSGSPSLFSTAARRLLYTTYMDTLQPIQFYDTTNRVSNHDPDKYNSYYRDLIWNWYDTSTCHSGWTKAILDNIKNEGITNVTEGNWQDVLTTYDPVNVVVMDPRTRTILQHVEAMMLSNMIIETKSVSTGQSPAGILFNSTQPEDYDFKFFPLDSGLKPVPTFSQPVPVNPDNDHDMNRTCVYSLEDDPAFNYMDLASCFKKRDNSSGMPKRVDTVWVCGNPNITCSTIPVAFKTNGKFMCRYMTNSLITNKECTEKKNGNCHEGIVSILYSKVRNEYKSQIPVPLPATVLPWFQANSTWAFSGFDLRDVLDYQDNIQPNPEKAIMCEIKEDKSSIVRLSECQSPHYTALKRHVERFYKKDGPVVIQPTQQLEWPVPRWILSGGVILSYTNMNRSSDKTFMDSLFDDETVCKGDALTTRRVCWTQSTGKFMPMNPWMLGNFNPFETCDVEFTSPAQGNKEIIFSQCAPSDQYPCGEFDNTPIRTKCKDYDKNLVTIPGVPQTDEDDPLAYNLCFHKIKEDPSGCLHDQGLLGGYDGLPVGVSPDASTNMLYGTKYQSSRYEVAKDMYNRSTWEIPDDFKRDFWDNTNPLWSGLQAQYGYLQVNDSHIGGHRIGLVINRSSPDDAISTLLVERLPLQSAEDGAMLDSPQASSGKVGGWVPGLRDAMQADHDQNTRLFEVLTVPDEIGASCPLQRWAFYSGNYSSFSPVIPSPRRSRHLFWRMHGGKLAHPTMQQVADGRYLGSYVTSNGFCACPVIPDIEQSQCLMSVKLQANQDLSTVSEACTLKDTVQALRGYTKYFSSLVFQPVDVNKGQRPCMMQMDWPNVDNSMRDGSSFSGSWDKASSPSGKKCHVLDRLRPFQYRYKSAQTMRASGLNTISHGACQTRRVVDGRTWTKTDTDPARCVRTRLDSSQAVIKCSSGSDTFTLPRPTQMSVSDTANARNRARQRCQKCSPVPVFKTNAGKSLPPESSFGRLYRTSAERLIAKDLRDTLCNVTGSCPQFNKSAWRSGQFMKNFLLSPEYLFVPAQKNAKSQPSQKPEDASRWTGRNWVYCPTSDALRTGQGCLGSMTRQAWTQDRVGKCSRMVRSFTNGQNGTTDQVARTPFCNIDNTTDLVCKAVETARQLVTQANCIASGDERCLPMPFVYHPASYEPSNNAWNYDTVSAYYTKINESSCPVTRNEQAFLKYIKEQDRNCPASSVQVVEGILVILRVIVADLALMISSLVSILVKLPALIVPEARPAVHQSILIDWKYLRKQGSSMVSVISDLFVDTMLNSGNAGLQIMDFLHTACKRINEYGNFFLNVWCNYVTRYMIEMVAGLKQAIGIIGSALEMFMDFMNTASKAILPAAFLKKYAESGVLQMIQQRYANPSAHDDKVAASNRVPSNLDAKPAAHAADARNDANKAAKGSMLSRVGKSAAAITENAGQTALKYGSKLLVAGALLSVGLEVFDAISRMSLPDLAPVDFMLDNLQDVVNTMDDMAKFLLMDQTCFVYKVLRRANSSYQFMRCLALDISSYENSSTPPHQISATSCWADANPSLGQNSLFSCTSSSSCCKTSACQDYIPCGTCPAPALELTNRFGCDSMIQKCVCGLAQSRVDSCSSNRQCDATKGCKLVSSLNKQNFGTIPCEQCPSGSMVMCLMPTTGFPGECACMLDSSIQYDICGDTSGTVTLPDASRLCAYIPGASLSRRSWVFDLEDLIMAPCVQIDLGVCSTVHVSSTTALRLVVGTSLRTSQGGRRLLSFEEDTRRSELDRVLDMPGWNTTAEPCRSLVEARNTGRDLGVMDTMELEKCAYWRHVGLSIIEEYNMTGLEGRDTFLLSFHDFLMCMTSKEAVMSLARAPEAMLTALLSHPWLYPLQELVVSLGNWVRFWAARSQARTREHPLNRTKPVKREKINKTEPDLPNFAWYAPEDFPDHGHKLKTTRKILSVQADAQNIQPINAPSIQTDVAQTGAILQRAVSVLTSFSWPPVYDYSLDTCPVAMSALSIGRQVVLVNKMYFSNFRAPPRPIDRSLRATLPDITWNLSSVMQAVPSRATSWASGLFHWALDLASISPDQIMAFFTTNNRWTLQWILASVVHCDLASTLTCSEHKKDLVMSVVVFILFYMMTNAVFSALGFPAVSLWLLLSFPFFILWYSFGMAPTCFPMLPPCLLADILAVFDMFLPENIAFPKKLLCDPRLSTANASSVCLRPCSDLNFTTWVDPLAFTVCDIDLETCKYLRNATTGVQFLDDVWAPAARSMHRFGAEMLTKGYEPAAYRMCTLVSWITITPWLLLGATVFVVSLAVLEGVLALIPGFVELMCRSFAFFMTQ